MLRSTLLGCVAFAGAGLTIGHAGYAASLELPQHLSCAALQTAGFHDYPHNDEAYEAVVFMESEFTLRINQALMRYLAADSPYDVFLTLRVEDKIVDLRCNIVRGANNSRGVSCSNTPPSELLLLNAETLRFTRTSIGGWTFAGADDAAGTTGDSIYVEYGRCAPHE